MDHDSVPLDLPGPNTHRIADVREAYAQITRHALKVMGKQITHESEYTSNKDGHFAWDISLLIRAACLTWRVTGNSVHLQQAVSWAQHVLERTDETLGLEDWRGRSGPVWSAGLRYTAAIGTLGIVGGVPIHVQGIADQIVFERTGPTSARMHAVRGGRTVWSLPKASLLPDDSSYLPDLLARKSTVHSVLVRGLSTPIELTTLESSNVLLKPQLAAHFVHTSMIARSLIAAGEVLDAAGSEGPATDVTPDDLFRAAERALLFHDGEIRVRSGQAWYITPLDFPGRRLGLEVPHNHVVDAATCFLIIGGRNRDAGLRDLGTSLTRRFLKEVEAYEAGALRHPWHYYPVDSDIFVGVVRDAPISEREVRAVQREEDSSHATIRARALVEWKAIDDRLVSDETMSSVVLSFRRFFMTKKKGYPTVKWLPKDGEGAPRLGRSDDYPGVWGSFKWWDSTIKRRINSMAYRCPPRQIFGATVLSAAEIHAMNSGVPVHA